MAKLLTEGDAKFAQKIAKDIYHSSIFGIYSLGEILAKEGINTRGVLSKIEKIIFNNFIQRAAHND